MSLFGFHKHRRDDPLEGASPAEIELYFMLTHIITNQEKIMALLDDLQNAVAAEDTVIDSAITLLQGLSAALAAAGTDQTKLTALQADITAKTQSLAAAVAANTPAAPTP